MGRNEHRDNVYFLGLRYVARFGKEFGFSFPPPFFNFFFKKKRRLALLKVKRSVVLRVFHAKQWLAYLEETIGLKPVNWDTRAKQLSRQLLRDYQRGAEHLDSWIDAETEDH